MAVSVLDDRLLNPESSLIRMRHASVEDVPLIYKMRHLERSKHMNKTSLDLADQYRYFDGYLEKFILGEEIYYVILDKKQDREVGIFRLTRLTERESYGWESLIVDQQATPGVAIDVATSVYTMGFEWLNRTECGPWLVPKSNMRVIRMHDVMGVAKKIGESGDNWIYSVEQPNYTANIGILHKRGFGHINGKRD